MQDSKDYLSKKKFFDKILTVYGRKPVLEALLQPDVKVHKLHLAHSNQKSELIDKIVDLANQKSAEITYHDRKALSRISKNTKQDQGVAIDLVLPGFNLFEDSNFESKETQTIIALDGITNPQNLGMIIRSVTASPAHGILISKKGCAKIDSLVIKASAGSIFNAQMYFCEDLAESLNRLKQLGFAIVGLDSHAKIGIDTFQTDQHIVYILGNETHGMSQEVHNTCSLKLRIPMHNNIESLNVAVTAALLAFKGHL